MTVSLDAIKLMVDVEEDVMRKCRLEVRALEAALREKEEMVLHMNKERKEMKKDMDTLKDNLAIKEDIIIHQKTELTETTRMEEGDVTCDDDNEGDGYRVDIDLIKILADVESETRALIDKEHREREATMQVIENVFNENEDTITSELPELEEQGKYSKVMKDASTSWDEPYKAKDTIKMADLEETTDRQLSQPVATRPNETDIPKDERKTTAIMASMGKISWEENIDSKEHRILTNNEGKILVEPIYEEKPVDELNKKLDKVQHTQFTNIQANEAMAFSILNHELEKSVCATDFDGENLKGKTEEKKEGHALSEKSELHISIEPVSSDYDVNFDFIKILADVEEETRIFIDKENREKEALQLIESLLLDEKEKHTTQLLGLESLDLEDTITSGLPDLEEQNGEAKTINNGSQEAEQGRNVDIIKIIADVEDDKNTHWTKEVEKLVSRNEQLKEQLIAAEDHAETNAENLNENKTDNQESDILGEKTSTILIGDLSTEELLEILKDKLGAETLFEKTSYKILKEGDSSGKTNKKSENIKFAPLELKTSHDLDSESDQLLMKEDNKVKATEDDSNISSKMPPGSVKSVDVGINTLNIERTDIGIITNHQAELFTGKLPLKSNTETTEKGVNTDDIDIEKSKKKDTIPENSINNPSCDELLAKPDQYEVDTRSYTEIENECSREDTSRSSQEKSDKCVNTDNKEDLGVHCLQEERLEGEGEQDLPDSTFPKLLRLQSLQEKATAALRRSESRSSVHEENSYLGARVGQLELLVDEMVTSNQEVLEEVGHRCQESRAQVWRILSAILQYGL